MTTDTSERGLDPVVPDQEPDAGAGTEAGGFANRLGHDQSSKLVDGSCHGMNHTISYGNWPENPPRAYVPTLWSRHGDAGEPDA